MRKNEIGKIVRKGSVRKIAVLGLVSCLVTGCGNVIPELTEEEASLIATYAADVVLETEDAGSRLMDTAEETAKREELSRKVEELKAKKALEEEAEQEEEGVSGGSAGSLGGTSGTGSPGSTAGMQKPENMAEFIGLSGFQVSYDGYEIKKSYSADEEDEWEPAFDASAGKNLLIVKLKVTNISGVAAVADVLSKEMIFMIRGDDNMGGMAFATMLLNDFAYAQDEIGAGESKQYVLITEVDESVTETGTLSLKMRRDGESMDVMLQ